MMVFKHNKSRPAQHVPADAGFTLIEMLVALGLTAVIAVMILESIRGARQASAQINKVTAETSVVAVQSYLRNVIASVRPMALQDPNSPDDAVLRGSADKLTFISSYAVAGQYGGLYLSTIERAPAAAPNGAGGETSDLVIRQRLYRPWDFQKKASDLKSETVVLLTGITALSVRYYGEDGEQAGAAWANVWRNRAKLPQLISIDVGFADKDPRRWPTLAAGLMLAEPVAK
jgi:prepilin-type N-terminal cleavage/methylation domain-containing protein